MKGGGAVLCSGNPPPVRKFATSTAESCSAAGAGGTPSMSRTSRSPFPPLPAVCPPGFPPLPAALPPGARPPRQGESGCGVGEQADAPAEQRPLEPEPPTRPDLVTNQ